MYVSYNVCFTLILELFQTKLLFSERICCRILNPLVILFMTPVYCLPMLHRWAQTGQRELLFYPTANMKVWLMRPLYKRGETPHHQIVLHDMNMLPCYNS